MENIVCINKVHSNLAASAKYIFILFFLVPSFVLAQSNGFGQISRLGAGGLGSSSSSTTNKRSSSRRVMKKDSVVSVIPDSLRSNGNHLETTVEYSADDSTILDVANETIYLYGNANVLYSDVELKADFIKLDWGKNEVYAHGLPDTTRKVGDPVRGKPIFSQGGDDYNSDTIRYNFKSKRAIIKNIITQQGEGIIHGERVKKDSLDNLYLTDALYTTCNLKDPHFHIEAKKIKLVNKQNVVAGPFHLEVADIPLPVYLPFGFFPVPKNKEIGTSGFVMGQYGEEPRNRGYYFRDFGYYHAFNELIGVKVLAQIYSRGSWGAGVQSNYTKRYRYTGNLSFQFNWNKNGSVLATKKDVTKDFSFAWSHTPQSRRPDRSFSASVNLKSGTFNNNNTNLQQLNTYLESTSNSSVQYSRNFGNLLRTSVSFNVSQKFKNAADTTDQPSPLSSNLGYSIGLNQFNPFVREENKIGRLIEEFRIGMNLNGGYQFSNDVTSSYRVTTYTDYQLYGIESRPLTKEEERYQSARKTVKLTTDNLLKYGQFQNSFSIPISLPNLKLAKYINITPGISFNGITQGKKLRYKYLNPDYIDPVTNKVYSKYSSELNNFGRISEKNVVIINGVQYIEITSQLGDVAIDTLSAIDDNKPLYASFNTSASLSLNTRVYGTYQFKKLGRLQAIRHTVSPSVSLSYTPDLTEMNFDYVQIRPNESRWLPTFPSVSSVPGQVGQISFGLSNQLEAKIRAKSDTAEKQFEKIMLLNNFGFSGGYNLLADSMKLSTVSFSANSTLFKDLININTLATFDPYAWTPDLLNTANAAGRRTKAYKWNEGGANGNYFSYFQISLSTRLSPKTFNKAGKDTKTTPTSVERDPAREAMERFVTANPLAYVDFNIPWSLNISLNYSYIKQGLATPQQVSAVQFTGDFSLTPKWKFNFSSGYDFQFKAPTLTTLGVIRELHCWDMSFSWTPIAGNTYRASSFSFDLKVRSSLLQDLKISRRRMYYDSGGF